jgi:hypothetical protein
MGKLIACSVASLSLVVPAAALAQSVCDQLTIGKISGPSPFPNTQTVTTPDISQLHIQIYTTRTLGETGEGLTHKCEIAHDMWEVDRMLKDVDFEGYPTETSMPIFTNTAVSQVQSGDVETVRDVVRALFDPTGVAAEAIDALTGNQNLFNETVLNVYYVHSDAAASQSGVDFLSALTGVHIRDEDGDSAKMIFIGDGAKSDTVAHEFAHAFSAGHLNFWDFDGKEYCIKFLPHPTTSTPAVNMECEFTNANYMWAASQADRAELIDAQKQRMMHNEHSIIYEYSPSATPTECPDFRSEDPCQRMGLP